MNCIAIAGMLESIKTMQTASGMLTKFTVGTHETYWSKKDDAEKTSRTPFDVVCWGKLAQATEHWRVGSYVEVQGKIQMRAHEPRQGEKKWRFELMAEKVKLVLVPPAEAPAASTQSAQAESEEPMPDLLGGDPTK